MNSNHDEQLKWFHGGLSRDAADELLKQGKVELRVQVERSLTRGYEDGTFLVRESSTATGDFVLSLLHQEEVCHYQIRRHGEDAFFSIDDKVQTKILHGLDTLVDYYQQAANGLITKLTVPLICDVPPHNTRSHGISNLLHRATSKNDSKVVFELLKCGYRNCDAKNQHGQTALHLAALYCDEDILKLLLNAGVQVNSMDSFGYQPLHYASRSKSANFIRTLIDAQANLQGRNIENGYVPLHEAAKHGNLAAVQELLAAQAPLLPRTSSGEFPFDLAKETGQMQVNEYLLNYKQSPATTSKEQWYHGTLTREEAIDILKKFASELRKSQLESGQPVDTSGCFLVRYSEKSKSAGYVLTLLSGEEAKNFLILQAELSQDGSSHSKFFYIDDGPYWPSLEHLVAHFMRFSYGLPYSLKYPVPPQPKPEVPSFSTIPRSNHKRAGGISSLTVPPALVAASEKHVPALPITKKKQKENNSSMFNTLRLNSPKKALFDFNTLRKNKSKNKRSESESSACNKIAASAKVLNNAEELNAAAPMLKSLSFSTDWTPLVAAQKEEADFYNVPKNNSAVASPTSPQTQSQLPSVDIAKKTEAEVEYFTKGDVDIAKERAAALFPFSDPGYMPTVDMHVLLDPTGNNQAIKELGAISKHSPSRLDSVISNASTESEMASILQRKANSSSSDNKTPTTSVIAGAKLKFFIALENLELDSVIGTGEFGSVYRGWVLRHAINGNGEVIRQEVAIKTLNSTHETDNNKEEFLREASVMIQLQHQCIVQFIGICKGESLMMVQEMAPLGSMLQYILNHSKEINPNFELKLWASQIACGMYYLEKQHFVHRDLAARNILLASRQQAKISDFGMSRFLGVDRDQYQFSEGGRWPIKWYAPESFNKGIFSHASDVWSFGVTLWEMFSMGQQPYGEILNVDAIKMVDNGVRLSRPEQCPIHIYTVIQSCWNEEPQERPTFAELANFFRPVLDYQNLVDLVQTVQI